jgi:DNA polymerase (family 10)
MAQAAMERGYEYMAVTEHSKSLGIAGGLDEGMLLKHIEAIDLFNEALAKRGEKFRVLKGSEVEILADGTLDHEGDLLGRLDCVVGAVHSGFEMGEEDMTARIINAFATGYLNIFAHPTGRLIGTRNPYAVDMERVVRAAKEYGVMLELNSYPERLDLNDVHLGLARNAGVLVAVSTDSHGVRGLDNMVFGVHTARRGWLEKGDVLNTRGLKEVRKLLKGRGR